MSLLGLRWVLVGARITTSIWEIIIAVWIRRRYRVAGEQVEGVAFACNMFGLSRFHSAERADPIALSGGGGGSDDDDEVSR